TEAHFDIFRTLDHVQRGEDVSLVADDDTGAEAAVGAFGGNVLQQVAQGRWDLLGRWQLDLLANGGVDTDHGGRGPVHGFGQREGRVVFGHGSGHGGCYRGQ